MGNLLMFLSSYPFWFRIAALAFIFSVPLELIVWAILSRIFLIKRLVILLENPERVNELIFLKYNSTWILNRSGTIENFAKKYGINIIYHIKMDDLWINNFISKKRVKDFNRILKYAPDKGLFKCFLIGLKKKKIMRLLLRWINKGEYLLTLRRLALSGKGEDFDKKKAFKILNNKLNELREMTGDPEWQARYFAISILMYDSDERSIRAVWDGFIDQQTLIRKTVANEYFSDDAKKLYDKLFYLFINDSIYEVRKIAWERIKNELSNLYFLEQNKLDEDQKLHVLELLRDDSKEDENYALKILDDSNLELRLAAAIFLNKNGALRRLICNVDLGDKKLLERNYKLLEKAVEVNITGFLSCIYKNNNPATLLIAAKLLCSKGDINYITILSRKVFNLSKKEKAATELYKRTLESISKRGNEKAFILLLNELKERKHQKDFIDQILANIPERSNYIFIDILIELLKDINFKQRNSLKKSLLRMPSYLVLPEIFKIIKQEEKVYLSEIRLDTIRLLGEMEMPYCLQSILENIYLLNINETKEFTKVLNKYPRKILINKVKNLLNKNDVKIRTSIISILPIIGESIFLNLIIKSLKDADPEVRIASLWAIVDFQDQKAIAEIINLLKDPIDRVRREASNAIGKNGNKSLISELKSILNDQEETREVRIAAIRGLGLSKVIESVDVLIDRLNIETELEEEIIKSLSQKKEKEELSRMIDNFKNASPELKIKISRIFKIMGEIGEERLIVLLKEKDLILKPYIINILESIGYIEKLTRKLSHKDYYVRKDAAELLSFIGTKSAFRGIILAANDPVEEVRVKVIKAIEKLETKRGKEILTQLQTDPNKRVRKYTQWAIERLKAKEL